jgi:hypothetical protein
MRQVTPSTGKGHLRNYPLTGHVATSQNQGD